MFLFHYVLVIFVALKNKKMSRKLRKEIYLLFFALVVGMLSIVRCVRPEVQEGAMASGCEVNDSAVFHQKDNQNNGKDKSDCVYMDDIAYSIPQFKDSHGNYKKTGVYSVPGFRRTFPDLQDVQLTAAKKWGVAPVRDRAEAEMRKDELVYVGANPFYTMDDKMGYSVPYLVPHASNLLQKISRNFMDSLAMKRIPLHTLIVTSVLRTEDDVRRLRRVNVNASPESCHRYGTTVDICYNRFNRINKDKGQVSSATLKWVLSEVLRDLRKAGECYVKYEVKQGCFHITVR